MAPGRATIDFFAAQAAAKRRTAVLVVWFALALLGTIAVIWAALGGVFGLSASPAARRIAFGPELALAVAGAVAAVTAIGASVHHARLARGGGEAVARMLGGVPVDRRSEDPGERRLVNVAEEMAIAAGLPVPALYVLGEERGINAFAAGFSPERAVVAVTRGALDELSRDELQGVVAHELSHVLNGDARLNLQLLAWIGGITVLASVGRLLARASRGSRWSSRRGGGAGIVAAGLCIWVAGSVGALFGRVIRAAVSRQRELLADAAAVQFTRNPEGLAGALAKIARIGSRVHASFAPEAAHLFFANGLASRWLATHPPVEERIRRLLPQGFARVMRAAAGEAAAPAAPAASFGLEAGPLTASALVASAGRPGPAHVAQAARVLVALPADVVAAAREPAAAAALVRALLADREPQVRALQLRALGDAPLRIEVERLATSLAPVGRGDRMAVLDLALPALDGLAPQAAAPLRADLEALARADGRTTLFEWAVLRVVERRLSRTARRAAVTARTLGQIEVDALDVLSALAWAGAGDEAGAQAALDAALSVLGVRGWRVLPRDRIEGTRLEAALARIEGASPPLKARLLEACAASALADGRIRAAEGEIVRAVAASLGVPVPPLAPPAAAGAASGAGAA